MALLLDGHADLVARAGADGAHLTGIAEFTAAIGQLKPERIAGAGGLTTRHDAMAAAEAGADYVMFGEPDAAGERPSFDAIEERVAWWAEVFEAPCVGFAASIDEVAPLVKAGADFVALGDWVWRDPHNHRGDDCRCGAACACRRPRHDAAWRSTWSRCLPPWCSRALRRWRSPKIRRPPPAAPNAAPGRANADVAFGAYQRGFYLTALAEATKRAQQNDPPAMTLLGELYAQGLGVGRDDSKAAQWYKQAAALGDRDAMFALAMFNFEGRAGPRNPEEAARLLAAAAKLGHPAAAYDLGLLYLQGQQFPQDFARAAELFSGRPPTPEIRKRNTRSPPCQGRPRRAEGRVRGRAPDGPGLGRRQCRRHGRVRHRPVQRRKAPPKAEPAAANSCWRRAAAVRSPTEPAVAHPEGNEPSRGLLRSGRAIKWHLIAKAGGAGDPERVRRQADTGRARGGRKSRR